jgi:hypothetical protein
MKLKPGSWRLKVSHVVEHEKVANAPPNWIGGSLVRADGTHVNAELGAIPLDLTSDMEVRVAMQPATD